MAGPSRLDRVAGCLIGQAVADGLGAPFEGLTAETIWRDFGSPHAILSKPSSDAIYYTDDTQMAIGVAEQLIADGEIRATELFSRFVANYETTRGYGPGIRKILDAVHLGRPWEHLIADQFPGGSFGNGAAMRVAPVGLFFSEQPAELFANATASAMVTHRHPLGIDGAVIMAFATAFAFRSDGPLDTNDFFTSLVLVARTEEFQWQLRTAATLNADAPISFGSSLAAHRSVTSALICFARHPDSYIDAVAAAIALGDDTDTLASMVGALVGARKGLESLPIEWIARLENQGKGCDYIFNLAESLTGKMSGR